MPGVEPNVGTRHPHVWRPVVRNGFANLRPLAFKTGGDKKKRREIAP